MNSEVFRDIFSGQISVSKRCATRREMLSAQAKLLSVTVLSSDSVLVAQRDIEVAHKSQMDADYFKDRKGCNIFKTCVFT